MTDPIPNPLPSAGHPYWDGKPAPAEPPPTGCSCCTGQADAAGPTTPLPAQEPADADDQL